MNTKFKKIAVLFVVVMTTLSLSMNAFAWGKNDHKTCVTDAAASVGITLSPEEKVALQFGSIFPDEDEYNDPAGKGTLHGTLWTKDKDGYNANYIGNYIYLTKIADLLGNGKAVAKGTVSQSYGMYANDYTNLNGYITCNATMGVGTGSVGGWTWNEIFDSIGIPNNAANRRAFIYGVALHVATDVFAHSTWTTDSSGIWRRITHENTGYGVFNSDKSIGADFSSFKTGRIMAAKEVAGRIITRFKSNPTTIGKVADFIVSSNCFSGTEGKFLIGNYAYYAYVSGKTTGETNVYNQFFKGDLAYQCAINGGEYSFYGNKQYDNWW
ncbi:zinc dependent phospholipase C family protein [Ruminiclostridium cellulolyticum]|uniref:Phospholipase C/D domain-containing protein n=1 Tax=Ruminiclostridium cellulolyticum (strain ATCC 35319 / DSM 5812 / JCM 6584 / H10) TaxID=394503 RepID=B8I5G2_RUMCH|nr:zinc dependent phospholipase C family protein [Ruminiclostridium cellulolyticum]ACL76698.1 hypothetical protein Ccel_2365 [Ruminiclostridium cellulolyticum H10]